MRYRNRTELVYEILQAANSGATKPKIMYKTFLSYEQLRQYLTMMVENGLLLHEEHSQIYRTTEKGLRFIKLAGQASKLEVPF